MNKRSTELGCGAQLRQEQIPNNSLYVHLTSIVSIKTNSPHIITIMSYFMIGGRRLFNHIKLLGNYYLGTKTLLLIE